MLTYPPLYGSLPIGAVAPYVAPTSAHEQAIFLSSKEIDRATLVGSSEVSSLPVSYLQDIQPQKKWRTTSKAGQYLNATFLTPVAANAAAFVAPNFTASTVCRIYFAAVSGDLLAAPDYDSGWMSVWPGGVKPYVDGWPVHTCVVRFANDSAYKYGRIEFADPSAEIDYFEMGRVLFGRSFQPRFNIDVNPGLGLQSPDAQARTPFGHTYTDPRGDASRRMVLPISAVNHNDMKRELFELQRYCGLARDFVFNLDPGRPEDSHLYTMQSLFTDSAQFEAQPLWDSQAQVWRTSLSLTEPL